MTRLSLVHLLATLSVIHGLLLPLHHFVPRRSPTRSLFLSNTNNDNNRNNNDNTNTQLTDWVVQGLEDDGSSVTRASATQAGENDTLPEHGLVVGPYRVLAAAGSSANSDDTLLPIRLLLGRNGWGTGVHPTTRLCLEWIAENVQPGDSFLDYGCGSGILSIAALHQGAQRCYGIDVEAEALVTAERNVALNDYDHQFQGLHTREVLPNTWQVDVCVANILIGQLVRPSMVAALVTNLKPSGLLCLSGIRPTEVSSLQQAYGDSLEWIDEAQLAAQDTDASLDSYGFDCGTWARLVGRKRVNDNDTDWIDRMSELAVS